MKQCVTTFSSSGKYSRIASCIHLHPSSETRMVQSALGSIVLLQSSLAFVPPFCLFLYFSPTMVFVPRSTWSSYTTSDGFGTSSSREKRTIRRCFGLVARAQQRTISISSIVFPHHFTFHSSSFPPVLSAHFLFKSHMCRDGAFCPENIFHGRNDVISDNYVR